MLSDLPPSDDVVECASAQQPAEVRRCGGRHGGAKELNEIGGATVMRALLCPQRLQTRLASGLALAHGMRRVGSGASAAAVATAAARMLALFDCACARVRRLHPLVPVAAAERVRCRSEVPLGHLPGVGRLVLGDVRPQTCAELVLALHAQR